MNAFFKVTFGLYFGFGAVLAFEWVLFELIGIPSGPGFGPIFGVLGIIIGIAAFFAFYGGTPKLLRFFGVEPDLNSSLPGRLIFASNAAFFAVLVWTVWRREQAIQFVFIPLALLSFAFIVKWVWKGKQIND